jgi:hypothetical protein
MMQTQPDLAPEEPQVYSLGPTFNHCGSSEAESGAVAMALCRLGDRAVVRQRRTIRDRWDARASRKFQKLDFLVTQLGRPLEGNDPAGGAEILEQMKSWYGRHQIVQSHQALA